ncbi:MAG: hypothetical protein ACTHOU_02855 [Aureliella sp.]
MKASAVALCVLSFVLPGSSVWAQCGCGGMIYPPPISYAPMSYASPMGYPLPVGTPQPGYSTTNYLPGQMLPQQRTAGYAPQAPGSVAFVNRLSPPVSRGTYTLNYAVHLSDGRILLTDFLPAGYQATGSEYIAGGRRVQGTINPNGMVVVRDPQSNATIATLSR